MKPLIMIAIFTLANQQTGWTMSQKPKEQSPLQSMSKASGKSNGYFQMNIEKQDNGNGDITLIAHVLPRNAMSEAEFMWKLPEGIKTISGEIKGEADFKHNELKSFTIVLSKESLKDKDQIFFFAHKTVEGQRHGGTKSYIHSKEGDFNKSQIKNSKSKQRKKPKKYFQ